ncbi:MAG: hypothetical protein LBV60_22600, partial [Streptomyces sp.]|nr:hypothetical protein [Streptomyces sp.]
EQIALLGEHVVDGARLAVRSAVDALRTPPAHTHGVDILHFRATTDAPPTAPTTWRTYADGRRSTPAIPCGHYDMLDPTALATIGPALSAWSAGGPAAR